MCHGGEGEEVFFSVQSRLHRENGARGINNDFSNCREGQWCNCEPMAPRRGGLHLKPPKFEQIFVAVITFSPFLLCKYF